MAKISGYERHNTSAAGTAKRNAGSRMMPVFPAPATMDVRPSPARAIFSCPPVRGCIGEATDTGRGQVSERVWEAILCLRHWKITAAESGWASAETGWSAGPGRMSGWAGHDPKDYPILRSGLAYGTTKKDCGWAQMPVWRCGTPHGINGGYGKRETAFPARFCARWSSLLRGPCGCYRIRADSSG